MELKDCYEVGHILRLQGHEGAMLVSLDVDYPEEYKDLESVLVAIDQKAVPFFIKSFTLRSGHKAILEFEDVCSPDEVAHLVGRNLYLPGNMLPELEADQFYFHEIIGFRVLDQTRGEIGEVKDVYELPKHEVLAVMHQGVEVLIPLQDEILLRVDKEARELHVDIPDGLLELYL